MRLLNQMWNKRNLELGYISPGQKKKEKECVCVCVNCVNAGQCSILSFLKWISFWGNFFLSFFLFFFFFFFFYLGLFIYLFIFMCHGVCFIRADSFIDFYRLSDHHEKPQTDYYLMYFKSDSQITSIILIFDCWNKIAVPFVLVCFCNSSIFLSFIFVRVTLSMKKDQIFRITLNNRTDILHSILIYYSIFLSILFHFNSLCLFISHVCFDIKYRLTLMIHFWGTWVTMEIEMTWIITSCDGNYR